MREMDSHIYKLEVTSARSFDVLVTQDCLFDGRQPHVSQKWHSTLPFADHRPCKELSNLSFARSDTRT